MDNCYFQRLFVTEIRVPGQYMCCNNCEFYNTADSKFGLWYLFLFVTAYKERWCCVSFFSKLLDFQVDNSLKSVDEMPTAFSYRVLWVIND